MQKILPVLALTLLYVGRSSSAGTAVYRPLGTWGDPQQQAIRSWEAERQARAARAAAPAGAGLRPHSLELLEDVVLQKNRISSNKAHDLIVDRAQNRVGRNYLNGIMAEALFSNRNPAENWSSVRRANAPQHDFTRPAPGGRGRENVQVKFHEGGNPARYAVDMRKDWRANWVAVPDDHVGSLKEFWKQRYDRLNAAGNVLGARDAMHNSGRVIGIGATSTEIVSEVRRATSYAAREQYATYTSFGAALAVGLGPAVWGWANGDLPPNQAVYRMTRAFSILGVGVGTDLALLKYGAVRGGLRGNVIVGTAVTIAEVTWLVYEHGWNRVFYQPVFYEQVIGGISAFALGASAGAGATALAVETGPWAPVIGTGVALVAGTAGYFGGRAGTHMILEIVSPSMLQQRERERLTAVQAAIDNAIANATQLPAR